MRTHRRWIGILMLLVSAGWADRAAIAQTPSTADAAPVRAPATTSASDDAAQQLSWPRRIKQADVTFLIYQPQIEKWADTKLEARAAVAVETPGQEKQSFGVIWLTARTEVDKVNRIVTLDDIQIPKMSFPQDKNREPEYLAMLRNYLGDATREVPIDHLEANLAATEAAMAAAKAEPVKNDPPKIIFSTTPALLVLIDGNPAMQPVSGQQGLMRVINTRACILFDEHTSRYYLHAMRRWLMSPAPTGPWQTAVAQDVYEPILKSLVDSKVVDALDPASPETAPSEMPDIYVSTTPAELIQTQGEPTYTPIPDTSLLYVKNTDSALFKTVPDDQLYLLVSGRWFKSATVNGPWTSVAGKDLPPDFAKIPPDSPKANVLASVPGTPQAKEALIANFIPQTATVKITEARLDVPYDGEPKFETIKDAKGLSYAVNTALPVIRIDDAKTYWCVSNGVWFMALQPQGPWVVATSVPAVIYTIPLSSPLHYVTYVRVYGSTSEVVYVGYTPGSMGTSVSTDGVVVYGTGYYYPAYVGSVWVGYPVTYGYGASFACGYASGFAFGFAAGAVIGGCWSQPYWGPCWGYGHVDINTSSVYRNWRGGVTYTNGHYSYNGYTGESVRQRGAASFNPYSGRASVGGYTSYFDRSDGDFEHRAGGATYNPRTGTITAGGRDIKGNIYDGDVDVSRGGIRYNTRTDTGIAVKDGDVYAGRDGNVYRRTDEGWQQRTDGGWTDAQRQGINSAQFSAQRQQLDQARASRSLGQQRFQGRQSVGGGYRSRGGGGGGARGRR